MTLAADSKRILFRYNTKAKTKHMKPGACCINSKAQKSVFKNVLCNLPALSEMPDVKAEDEVDFRASSVSEEVAVGSIAATLKMKQGPMTQVVSGISKSI